MTRSILITGAGAGIGRATARRFLAEGWEVTLLGRRRAALEETAEGHSARILTADVGDPDAVEAAFAELPRLDVLFNNAGISAPAAPIDDIPVETWLEVSRGHRATAENDGVLCFGSVHPFDPTFERRLDAQKAMGARGVKIHPAVQLVRPDHPRAMKVYRACGARDLPILIHCGPVDIEKQVTFPVETLTSRDRLLWQN